MSEIAELCLRFFAKSIPAKGKPKPGGAEWTVYSAIVQEKGSELTVVAAGTGSKVSLFLFYITKHGQRVRKSDKVTILKTCRYLGYVE